MRKVVFTVAMAGALAAAALGQAGNATAESHDDGYSVQINGMPFGPLSRCMGEDVHRLPGASTLPGRSYTPHLDVACPSHDN